MLQQVAEKRRSFHDKMRKEQIEHGFRMSRWALQHPSQFVKQQLFGVLKNIKVTIESEKWENLLHWLQQYLKIAEKHRVGQFLLTSVIFSHELPLVREGDLPVECSVGQLFVLLTQRQPDLDQKKELLSILEVNTHNLKIIAGKHEGNVEELLKITVDNLPFDWCKDSSLWLSFLKVIDEILNCIFFLGFDSLLVEREKEFLQCLEIIGSDSYFLFDEQHKKQYIDVCIFVLMVKQQSKILTESAQIITELIMKEIVKNLEENIDNLGKNCEYLRRIWMSGARIEAHCLNYLEKYHEKSIQNKEPLYFQMINTLLSFEPQPISQEMFQNILIFTLGYQSCFKQKQTCETKKWMIVIIRRQFIIRDQRWNHEELQSFSNILHQNPRIFPEVLAQLFKYSKESFEILVQIVSQTLTQIYESGQLSSTLANSMVQIQSIKTNLDFIPDQ